MVKAPSDQRRARRHNVKNFQLCCSQVGLLSFLSKAQESDSLPVINISLGGAQFLSSKKFGNGQRLRIRLASALEPEPVTLEAEVRWCQQVPRRGAFRVGVQFVAPESPSRQRLQELEARLGELTIRLLCPGCGAAFSVKKRFEGSAGLCPKCKTSIEVCDEERLPELPTEKAASDASRRSRSAVPVPGAAGLSPALSKFIRTAMPTRSHLDVVQHFARRPAGQVAGIGEISLTLALPEPKVHAIMKDLVASGVLKEIGVKTFNYDPLPEAKRCIAEVATLLTNPAKRSLVLALVLDAEKRQGK